MIPPLLWEVIEERMRQDAKHGAPPRRGYTRDRWLRTLVEEVGEVARAIDNADDDNLHEELVHVAATAAAFLEALPSYQERGQHEEPV